MSSLVAESDVLKPLSPARLSEKYEAEWPVFELTNAIVTDKDGAVVNLFSASEQNLLVVSGELVQKKEQAHHYKSSSRRKTVYLEVNPVGRFAFGADETGGIQIWAAGRSGWFELSPSLEYVATHAVMMEAALLWYTVLDHPKLQNATGKDLFLPWPRKNNVSGRTPEDVFRKHAAFLIEQMDKTSASWSRKPLYQYLMQARDAQFSSKQRQRSSPAVDTSSHLQPRPYEGKRRGRPPKEKPPEVKDTRTDKVPKLRVPVDELKRIETEGAVLWKFIQRASETVSAARPEALTMNTMGYMIYTAFVFDDAKHAVNYIRFQAPYLLRVMQERRQRRIWADTPFHNELADTILSRQLIGKMGKVVLQVREYVLGEQLAKGGLDVYASSDEEIEQFHGKSSLRPKSAGKGGKGKAATSKSYIGSKDQEEQPSTGSRTPRKRKFEPAEQSIKRSKRNRTESISQLSNEDGAETAANDTKQNSDSSSSENDEPDQPVAADKSLPLRWKTGTTRHKASRIGDPNDNNGIISPTQPLPTVVKGATLDVTPNAAGDVWHCTALGCMQTVYGASGALGVRLIDAHVREHREQEEGRPQFSVVMEETHKTNLPVSNLIKRIREYAAAKELVDAIAGAERDESF